MTTVRGHFLSHRFISCTGSGLVGLAKFGEEQVEFSDFDYERGDRSRKSVLLTELEPGDILEGYRHPDNEDGSGYFGCGWTIRFIRKTDARIMRERREEVAVLMRDIFSEVYSRLSYDRSRGPLEIVWGRLNGTWGVPKLGERDVRDLTWGVIGTLPCEAERAPMEKFLLALHVSFISSDTWEECSSRLRRVAEDFRDFGIVIPRVSWSDGFDRETLANFFVKIEKGIDTLFSQNWHTTSRLNKRHKWKLLK